MSLVDFLASRRSAAVPLALTAAAVAAAAVALLAGAAEQDRIFAADVDRHVAHDVAANLDAVARVAESNGWWTDMVERVARGRVDAEWLDAQIYEFYAARDGISHLIVVDDRDRIVYARAGDGHAAPDAVGSAPGLDALVRAARTGDVLNPPKVSGAVEIGGAPFVAGAFEITEDTVTPETRPTGYVLVAARDLRATVLAPMRDGLPAAVTRLDVGGPSGIPVLASDGREIARIAWAADMPGAAFLRQALLPASAMTLLVGGLLLAAWAFGRRSAIALREAEARARAQRDEAIAQSRAAEDASRAKSMFLATMSHELRTPLNAVIGFAEIIKDRRFGDDALPRYAGYAEDIWRSGRHLLALITDVLDFSKAEAGRIELDEDEFDLDEAVRSASRLVVHRAELGGVSLADETPGGIVLRADRRRVVQMLVNLLSNAAKFSPPGRAVRVSAEADGRGLSVSVRDQGPGIAPEHLARLGEAFYQVRRDAHLAQDGTGLGLALTRRLIELHGGSLEIESELGVGTCATLRFPAARVWSSPRSQAA